MLLLHKVLVTFLHCFQVYTSLYCFLFSYWRPASIIIVFKRLHIFGLFSRWNYITFFCVNVTKGLYKGISIASNWTVISNCWTHSSVTITQGFILSIWVIQNPFYSYDFFSWRMRTLHLTAFNSKFPFLFDFLSYNFLIFEQFKSSLSNRNMSPRNNPQSFLQYFETLWCFTNFLFTTSKTMRNYYF